MPEQPLTYEQALAAADRKAAMQCTEAEHMAAICDTALQTMVGAASPKLVWEAAQKRGMTTKELVELCRTDPLAVHDLMWE